MFRKAINEALITTGKQENLAFALGITPATLSRKINGESGWHEEEINKIFELSGGCKRCKEIQTKRLNAYNEVLRAQLEYIEMLERKIS